MATNTHIRTVTILLVSALSAICGAILASTADTVAARASDVSFAAQAAYSYRWPVKPFDRPHPIRGSFGDPRTSFKGQPTQRGLFTSHGTFAFHFGVDIAVPDGTPVYPVRSGVASLRSRETVSVNSGNGVYFQYWHIVPTVRDGQHVEAYETVLGHVRKGYEHVHLSEIVDGQPVNPVAPGHMGPYDDATRPQVEAISFRRAGRAAGVLPEFVTGSVDVIAATSDMPALAVPGRWNRLPVAPALVTWRIVEVKDGRTVAAEQVAFDVRRTLPRGAFWRVYARGTRQNMANFGGHKYWRQPGVYLLRLGTLNSRRLRDGIYAVVVTATDIRGNESSGRQVFTVNNKPGW
jgi:hypothetical protein